MVPKNVSLTFKALIKKKYNIRFPASLENIILNFGGIR